MGTNDFVIVHRNEGQIQINRLVDGLFQENFNVFVSNF